MFNFVRDMVPESWEFPKEKETQILSYLRERYPEGNDPWGLNLNKAHRNLKILWPLYDKYFKVRIFGKENVPEGPVMVVSNHSGQIAIDGILLGLAFALDIYPPRILRGMVDRFFNGIPFIGSWGAECGAVLGDRTNCQKLLEKGESIMVFPEGVKGIAKSTHEYYQLKKFTLGFYRLALTNNTPIIPVSVIGAEEFYPFIYQAKGLAEKLGLPALPLSPTMLLGPLGVLPLPSPVDIHIGEPIMPNPKLGLESLDKEIESEVMVIQETIQKMIEEGRKDRRPFWANKDQ